MLNYVTRKHRYFVWDWKGAPITRVRRCLRLIQCWTWARNAKAVDRPELSLPQLGADARPPTCLPTWNRPPSHYHWSIRTIPISNLKQRICGQSREELMRKVEAVCRELYPLWKHCVSPGTPPSEIQRRAHSIGRGYFPCYSYTMFDKLCDS